MRTSPTSAARTLGALVLTLAGGAACGDGKRSTGADKPGPAEVARPTPDEPVLPEPKDFDDGADPACIATAHAAITKDAPDAERRFHALAARCLGKDVDRAVALVAGHAEADVQRLASQLRRDQIAPDFYLAGVRDRDRKVARAVRDPGYALAVAAGDADGDLVPDPEDSCASSPELEATDEKGCPLGKLPRAPDREAVQRAIHGLRVIVSPACDDAAPLQIPSPIALRFASPGVARRQAPGDICTPESTRELCHDGIDNNCNGQVEEGCPEQVMPPLEVVVSGVNNQPKGCLVMYQVDAQLIDSRTCAPGKCIVTLPYYSSLLFRQFEGVADAAPGGLRFEVPSAAAGARGQLYQRLLYYRDVRWQVRAINGNGATSNWSQPVVQRIAFRR